MTLGIQETEWEGNSKIRASRRLTHLSAGDSGEPLPPKHSLFQPTFIIFPHEGARVANHLERAALCQCSSRSRDRSRPNAIAKPAGRVDNCASQSGGHPPTDDPRR